MANFLTVEDSLQYAAGSFKYTVRKNCFFANFWSTIMEAVGIVRKNIVTG
jgi:hypothetical protein